MMTRRLLNCLKTAVLLSEKRTASLTRLKNTTEKPATKTCFKGYWESGLFKKQIDKLLEYLPFLQESKTIHVDNFQCYHNYAPRVTIAQMQDYRRK